MDIQKGSTDRSVTLRILDSTTFLPKTDVVYTTSGLDLWYRREGAAVTSITEATLAAVDSAHSDGGFIHIGAGYYRVDAPDAAFATGANKVMFGGVCTGCIIIGQEIRLVNYSPEDAVRLGLTALPNANADAAGGIPISDAGGLDLDAKLANTNEITTARMGALSDWINGGRLDLILDDILTDTGTTLDTLIKDIPTVSEFEARTIPSADYTIVSDLGVVQTGDSYTIVNNATYGNSALETLVDDIESALSNATYGLNALLTAVNTRLATAGYTAPPTVGQITDDILNELLSGHSIPGSVGISIYDTLGYVTALRSALTDLRASYLDAAISTRSIPSDIATALNTYDVPTKAELDSAVSPLATTSALSAVAGYVDTEVSAIKAKTDQLTFTSPNKVDATATVSTAGLATEANQTLIRSDIAGVITHGDSAWLTGGGMSGSNAITINVHDGDGVNVLQAAVEIWDSAGTAFYEKKFSNSSGQAVFNMDAGTYTVKISKAGYSFTDTALTVTTSASVTYTITAYVIGSPATAGLCRVYTYVFNPDGTAFSSVTSSAVVSLVDKNDNNFYAGVVTGVYNTTTKLLYWDIIKGAKATVSITEVGLNRNIFISELEPDTKKLDDLE